MLTAALDRAVATRGGSGALGPSERAAEEQARALLLAGTPRLPDACRARHSCVTGHYKARVTARKPWAEYARLHGDAL